MTLTLAGYNALSEKEKEIIKYGAWAEDYTTARNNAERIELSRLRALNQLGHRPVMHGGE